MYLPHTRINHGARHLDEICHGFTPGTLRRAIVRAALGQGGFAVTMLRDVDSENAREEESAKRQLALLEKNGGIVGGGDVGGGTEGDAYAHGGLVWHKTSKSVKQ